MKCEIVGEVDGAESDTPCPRTAARWVSVGSLSPLGCCVEHAEAMKIFWEPHLQVIVRRLYWPRVRA